MSQSKNDTFNPFDPTGMFKELRDNSVESWSKLMIDLVHTDAYAEATGSMLDAWLTSSGPLRKALETSVTQTLANLNLPTRDDITSLAGRMTNIEMRLDDIEAKLDESLKNSRAADNGTKKSSNQRKKS